MTIEIGQEGRPSKQSIFDLSKTFCNVDWCLPVEGAVAAREQIKRLNGLHDVRDLARIYLGNTFPEVGRQVFTASALIHGVKLTERDDYEFDELDVLLRQNFAYRHNPIHARYLFDFANEMDLSDMRRVVTEIGLKRRHFGVEDHEGPDIEDNELLALETDIRARELLRLMIRRVK